MERKSYSGLCAGAGKALGILYEKKGSKDGIDRSLGHSSAERERFYSAVNAAKKELSALADEAKGTLGEADGDIFFIHTLFLEDEDFLAAADRALSLTHTAEFALEAAKEYAVASLLETGDEIMMARRADVLDVTARVLSFLRGKEDERLPNVPFLYFSEDIIPSEVLTLHKSRCVGIILKAGAVQSHAAIIARAMSLPMLVEAEGEASGVKTALLDADRGVWVAHPDEGEIAAFRAWQNEQNERARILQGFRDKHFLYPTGRELTVAANIGSFAEWEEAARSGAEGIGLFRSELTFMEGDRAPSEEEQVSLYQRLIQAVAPRLAVIRVLDLGADKVPRWLTLQKEDNPALGLRGVRLLNEHFTLFRTQLRSILRATATGEAVILLPMIVSLEEVKTFKALLSSLADELVGEGYTVGHYTLGVMIETPSAALICRSLSAECGYFSIGSNDLFQYTMAIDRENPRALAYVERHPPALLSLISDVVKIAHETGVKVSLCGELAGDPVLTEWLCEQEFDVLSLSPSAILPTKERLANILKSREN